MFKHFIHDRYVKTLVIKRERFNISLLNTRIPGVPSDPLSNLVRQILNPTCDSPEITQRLHVFARSTPCVKDARAGQRNRLSNYLDSL